MKDIKQHGSSIIELVKNAEPTGFRTATYLYMAYPIANNAKATTTNSGATSLLLIVETITSRPAMTQNQATARIQFIEA